MAFYSSLHKLNFWASDNLLISGSWVSRYSTGSLSSSAVLLPAQKLPEVKRACSPSLPRFWAFSAGKIGQSEALWCVASCDASNKIESLLQKVELGSTLRNMLPQLATLRFVAWQVEQAGGKTGNNAFQLAMQQCCATSWVKMFLYYLTLTLLRYFLFGPILAQRK